MRPQSVLVSLTRVVPVTMPVQLLAVQLLLISCRRLCREAFAALSAVGPGGESLQA